MAGPLQPGLGVESRYRASGFPLVWAAGVPVFTAIWIALVVNATTGGDGPPVLFLAAWFAALVWFWYLMLVFISFEVTIFENNEIEFRSFVRRLRVSPDELQAVYPTAGRLDYYTVSIRTRAGTVRIPRMMNDFPGLTAKLRELKPGLTYRRGETTS